MMKREGAWRRLVAGASACARASAAALLLSSCADSHEDAGDVVLQWHKTDSNVAATLYDNGLVQNLAVSLNKKFKLPRDLVVVHRSCRNEKGYDPENAFYDPVKNEVVMCYELLDALAAIAEKQAGKNETKYHETVVATWTSFLFHEVGHALIDLYDLPIPGREEDTVDDFSTVLMITGQMSDSALLAAKYWAAIDSGTYDKLAYASDHALNRQRFYNIICLVYGSSEDAYRYLVADDGALPSSRAKTCPGDYKKSLRSWERLLEPWIKD